MLLAEKFTVDSPVPLLTLFIAKALAVVILETPFHKTLVVGCPHEPETGSKRCNQNCSAPQRVLALPFIENEPQFKVLLMLIKSTSSFTTVTFNGAKEKPQAPVA